MRLRILVAALSLVLAGSQRSGPVMLVPAASWRLVKSEFWTFDRLRERGLDPAVEREYGVSRIERREYELHGVLAEAFVFEAPDPSSAYGLFTFYSTPDFRPEPGTRLTRYSNELGLMARGRYLVRVPRPQSEKISNSEFRALLISIGGLSPGPRSLAQLPPALPAEGLVPGSEKYFLGPYAMQLVLPSFPVDLVGFAQGGEVQLGRYGKGNDRPRLILISYPTPQIARARFAHFQRMLPLDEEEDPDSFFGQRSGSFVFLLSGVNSKRAAARLMDQFGSKQEVTWNEPPPLGVEFALEVVNLFISNLILIGIVILLALTGGVSVFVGRRLIDRHLPQTMFAREENGGMILLGLDKI